MLQDAIWADAGRLADDAGVQGPGDPLRRRVDPGLDRTAVTIRRSVRTSSPPPARRSAPRHQLWMMNEVSKLIWPSPDGIGFIDSGGLGSHRRDQPEHPEPRRRDRPHGRADRGRLHQRDRRGGLGPARRHGSRPDGRGVRADRGHPHRRRRVTRQHRELVNFLRTRVRKKFTRCPGRRGLFVGAAGNCFDTGVVGYVACAHVAVSDPAVSHDDVVDFTSAPADATNAGGFQ